MTGLALWASYAKLKVICDQHLNAALERGELPFRYEPLPAVNDRSLVFLEILQYDQMRSIPLHDRGYETQNEMLFGFPVMRSGSKPGVAFFVPFVFVDNDWSVIAGREVIGYPKTYAEFELPSESSGATIKTRVFKTYGPNQHTTMEPIVTIPDLEPGSDFSSPSQGRELYPFGPIEDHFGDEGHQPQSAEVQAELKKVTGLGVKAIAFKEFRDAGDSQYACFQEIVGFSTDLKTHLGGQVAESKPKVTITPYASLKIAEHLGLELENDVAKPVSVFVHHADFELGNLEVICSGSAPPPTTTPSGCTEILSDGLELTKDLVDTQAAQWQEAVDKVRDGSYDLGDAVQDVLDTTKSYSKYSVAIAKLWLTDLSSKRWFS